MNNWGPSREVEKPPKTRTERHTRLYNQTLNTIGRLGNRMAAAKQLFADTPTKPYVPLSEDDTTKLIELLVALGGELKPDKRDGVA